MSYNILDMSKIKSATTLVASMHFGPWEYLLLINLPMIRWTSKEEEGKKLRGDMGKKAQLKELKLKRYEVDRRQG